MAVSGAAAPLDALFTPELIKKVQDTIDNAEATGTRVSAWDRIKSLLLDHHLAWSCQISPEMLGTHPDNRSKLGIVAADVHLHGSRVLQAGFPWSKASDVVCIESPANPEAAVEYNERLINLSSEHLPNVVSLRYLSVGGNHTNAFLRAVKASCKTSVASLQDEGGRLNLAKLSIGQPAFKEAVEKGLFWTVLHKQVSVVWPKLVGLLIKGLNTSAQNLQSELEVMMEMSKLRDNSLAGNITPDWTDIERMATMDMPPSKEYASALASYVKSQAPCLMDELNFFAKQFAKADATSRNLGSEYIAKAAALASGKTEKTPHLMHAALCANLVSPPQKIVDGFCKLFSPSNLASLLSKEKKGLSLEAENLMYQSRTLCDVLGLANGDASRDKCLGRLDVRCMSFLCKKQVEGNRQYSDLGEIAHAPAYICTCTVALGKESQCHAAACISTCTVAGILEWLVVLCAKCLKAFIGDLSSELGRQIAVPSGWVSHASSSSAGAAASAEDAAEIVPAETIADMKSFKYQAKKAGFHVGVHVGKKGSTEVQIYRIDHLSDDDCTLTKTALGADGDSIIVQAKELLAAWRIHKGAVTQKLNGWDPISSPCSPLQSSAFGFETAGGAILIAMRDKYRKHVDNIAHLRLLSSPNSVMVSKAFKAFGLVLVAVSKCVDRKPSSNSICVGSFILKDGDCGTKLYTSSCFTPPVDSKGQPNKSPFVVPFWLVKNVEDPTANMELRYTTETIGGQTIHVPTLVNTKALHPGDILCWNKKDAPEPSIVRKRKA